MEKLEVLALIPARGGSKSIPRKNIKPLAGFPLIAYSIAAGIAAETVTRVIVSTEDEQIAKIAKSYGAEVPFLRPAEFALDNTPDLPVFEHALKWLQENEQYEPNIIVQLRPTSPFRRVWRAEPYNMPRQALPDVYWQTGYVDAAWSDTIRKKNSMTGDYILPLVINSTEWVDIDSVDDWKRAEQLLLSGAISFDELGFCITKD